MYTQKLHVLTELLSNRDPEMEDFPSFQFHYVIVNCNKNTYIIRASPVCIL